MINEENKNKTPYKDSLLQLLDYRNVNILYPETEIKMLVGLTENELAKVWKEKELNKCYELLNGKLTDESEKNLIKEFKPTNIEIFKKSKDGKKVNRTMGYRDVYKNWVICKWLIDNEKSNLNDIVNIFKKFKKRNFNKVDFESTTYGYLLVDEDLSEYLKISIDDDKINKIYNNSVQRIDEAKPYVYLNWKWAYELYVNRAIIENSKNKVIKIDLENAFPNLSWNKINSFIRINKYKFKDIDKFEKLRKLMIINSPNNDEGVNYGFLIESYIVANFYLMIFKYHLLKKCGKENHIKSMISYVDDNYIVVGDDFKYENFKKSMNRVFKTEKSPFKINWDKFEAYEKGEVNKIINDTRASAAPPINGDTFSSALSTHEDYLDIEEKIIKSTIFMTKRQLAKFQISYKYRDIDEVDFQETFLEILENKYAKQWFSDFLKKYTKRDFQKLLSWISSNFNKFPNILLKVCDILISIKVNSKDMNSYFNINNFIKQTVLNISTHENNKFKLFEFLYKPSKKIVERSEELKISVKKDVKEIVNLLKLITDVFYEKVPKDSFNISKAYNREVVKAIINLNEKSKSEIGIDEIEKWFLSGYSNDNLADDDSYLAFFKQAIFQKLEPKNTNLLLWFRIKMALSANTRADIARNLCSLIVHIRKWEESEEKLLPSLWHVIDENDISAMKEIRKLVRYNPSGVRSEYSSFNKFDFLLMLRYFVQSSWKNGSRELEHYSNHGVEHSDQLIFGLSKINTPLSLLKFIDSNNKIARPLQLDTFSIIFSIYIHDLGLLDDEQFFMKSQFLKGIVDVAGTSDLTDWYINLRYQMTKVARQNHGDTSSEMFDVIYKKINALELINKTRDVSSKELSIALFASALHNGAKTLDFAAHLENNPSVFVLSYLDINDLGWKRIQRPYWNIGMSTSNPVNILHTVKDILVTDVEHKVLNIDNIVYGKAPFMKVESIVKINKDHFNTLLEKIKEDNKFQFIEVNDLESFLIYLFFNSEIIYGSQEMRVKKELFDMSKKIRINRNFAFELISDSRAYDYKNITMKKDAEFKKWNDKCFEDEKYVKDKYNEFKKDKPTIKVY